MTDPDKQNAGPTGEPPLIRPVSAPMEVPVFNIVIYISSNGGKVLARVANLPDIEFTASSEPVALKQTITHVKQQLSKWHTSGEPIPWIDPAAEIQDGEQERLVPVHL